MHFENYDIDQLCQILDLDMMDDANTKASEDGKKVAREALSKMSEQPRFGNPGDMENEELYFFGRNGRGAVSTSSSTKLSGADAFSTLPDRQFDPWLSVASSSSPLEDTFTRSMAIRSKPFIELSNFAGP